MNEQQINSYLKYLYLTEAGIINPAAVGKVTNTLGKEIKSGALFSLVFTPAAWLTWRSLSGALNKAVRKCGIFAKNTGGRQSCIAREKIKIFEQKLKLLESNRTNCKNEQCTAKMNLEIEKMKNQINRQQAKLREVLGEAIGIGSLIGMFAVGAAVDKAIFLSWRSATALFSAASRKCGVYKESSERDMCIARIKLQSLSKQIAILNQLKSKCAQSTNPRQCIENVEKKNEDLLRKIQTYQDTIKVGKKDLEIKRQEEQLKKARKS